MRSVHQRTQQAGPVTLKQYYPDADEHLKDDSGEVSILDMDFAEAEVRVASNMVLYEGRANCLHDIRPSRNGNLVCVKCRGWYCE